MRFQLIGKFLAGNSQSLSGLPFSFFKKRLTGNASYSSEQIQGLSERSHVPERGESARSTEKGVVSAEQRVLRRNGIGAGAQRATRPAPRTMSDRAQSALHGCVSISSGGALLRGASPKPGSRLPGWVSQWRHQLMPLAFLRYGETLLDSLSSYSTGLAEHPLSLA